MTDRYMVLVCGGRSFNDYRAVSTMLGSLCIRPTHIVTGGCSGADKLAQKWALVHNIPCSVYSADWDMYGKSAGPRRNQAMLDDCHPELVVAFPGGRGTADMVRRAKKEDVPVAEWKPHI